MHLVTDDYTQVYYWVDDNDICISPRFDYEEDAIQWYGKISKCVFEDFGIKKDLE